MIVSRPRSAVYQRWLFERPLVSHGVARTAVGEWCERYAARRLAAVRRVCGGAGVYWADLSRRGAAGEEWIEVKGVGRSGQAFVYGGRFRRDREFAEERALFYAFVVHDVPVSSASTVEELERLLAAGVRGLYLVPFARLVEVCESRREVPLNSRYGSRPGPSGAAYGSGFRFPVSLFASYAIEE